jgi:hypothetical protein
MEEEKQQTIKLLQQQGNLSTTGLDNQSTIVMATVKGKIFHGF